jgi:hypothetical protein
VRTLVGQRVLALALGYEDLNDHHALRHDPLLAAAADKLEGEALASAPTLNRLELSSRLSVGVTTRCIWMRPKRSRCCCASACKASGGGNAK